MYGWGGMRVEALSRLSLNEVRQMLRDVAWREVMDSWRGGKSLQVSRSEKTN